MRKIKTVLMIVILGMLFISCEEYIKDPLVKSKQIILATEADTVQYVVVKSDNDIYYFRVEQNVLVPEIRIMEKQTVLPIMFVVVLLVLVFIAGYGAGND